MRAFRLAAAGGLVLVAAGFAPGASASTLYHVVCMKDLDDRPVFPAACEAYEKLVGPVSVGVEIGPVG